MANLETRLKMLFILTLPSPRPKHRPYSVAILVAIARNPDALLVAIARFVSVNFDSLRGGRGRPPNKQQFAFFNSGVLNYFAKIEGAN